MKLGVFNPALYDRNFADACKFLKDNGVTAIEIGCGGFPGRTHCNPDILLNDEKEYNKFMDTIKENGLFVGAISVHGNAVHPDPEQRALFEDHFRKGVLMAEKMGVDRVITFSGCPGGSKDDKTPNWVTCPWPNDFSDILDYQWNEVLIPYWKKAVAFAKEHGINKIAFEMHPGFCVYNPETMLKLREAVGPELGANFDPSHLIWQGIDPVAAIKKLGDAIFFFHAKDTKLDKYNIAVNGVLDTKSYDKVLDRSWVFRTVGYGNDYGYWKDMISALKSIDYDYVISIEHEDSLMTQNEGLLKAIAFLKEVMTFDGKITDAWWI